MLGINYDLKLRPPVNIINFDQLYQSDHLSLFLYDKAPLALVVNVFVK